MFIYSPHFNNCLIKFKLGESLLLPWKKESSPKISLMALVGYGYQIERSVKFLSLRINSNPLFSFWVSLWFIQSAGFRGLLNTFTTKVDKVLFLASFYYLHLSSGTLYWSSLDLYSYVSLCVSITLCIKYYYTTVKPMSS